MGNGTSRRDVRTSKTSTYIYRSYRTGPVAVRPSVTLRNGDVEDGIFCRTYVGNAYLTAGSTCRNGADGNRTSSACSTSSASIPGVTSVAFLTLDSLRTLRTLGTSNSLVACLFSYVTVRLEGELDVFWTDYRASEEGISIITDRSNAFDFNLFVRRRSRRQGYFRGFVVEGRNEVIRHVRIVAHVGHRDNHVVFR